MDTSLLHPRDQIVAIMDRIYAHDMTTTSGGNVSIRDESGAVWITPARVDKGSLRREDIVRRAPDGALDGRHPPSSELPFHLRIYEARPDIRAVIHAHPGALVSFSICSRVPDTRVLAVAHELCGEVAFARYALPGSERLGERIGAEFASERKPNCVVLENHGIVVGGANLAHAFHRFEALEFTAATILSAHSLGRIRTPGPAALKASARALPARPANPPTTRGKEARRVLCEFARRAYSHRLVTGAIGALSARIRDDVFAITPQQGDLHTLEPADPVVVNAGHRPSSQQPSRAAALHRRIYRRHPEIQAVISACPVNATAFSISTTRLDTRTIPESYLFLKDVPTVDADDIDHIAATIGPGRPVALLRNGGALVAGRSMLDAFDRLEVLESTAAAILRSRPLGPIHPMSDRIIRELQEAFPQV
jgi:L-fuculose-phosphate aldolase